MKNSEPSLDKFLRCLVNNCRNSESYYKIHIYGDKGLPNYPSKQYPRILAYFIKYVREDSVFIYTRDSDNITLDTLEAKFCVITEKVLTDKNRFQVLPEFNKLSKSNYIITNRSNNIINLHHCSVPKSLEFQVANIYMKKEQFDIPKTIQNEDHRFLDEIIARTGLNKIELLKFSVSHLINEPWMIKISEYLNAHSYL